MRNTYTIDNDVNFVNEMSHKNEPETSLNITVDVRQYPSMFEVYDAFEHMFKTHYFILGNGFENVMKNVLLALKPKTMGWVTPTWGMLDVYCEALNITSVNKSFEYKDNRFVHPNFNDEIDVFYTTYSFNNLFKHTNINLNSIKSTYNIVDVSYLPLKKIKKMTKRNNDKTIIIGSFDKIYGCGVRLGFAIYPKHLHNDIQLQREQYINSIAEEIILNNYTPRYTWYNKVKKILPENSIISYNYVTIPYEYNGSEYHKTFTLSGKIFTRFGMPYNKRTYNKLEDIINGLERSKKIILFNERMG